MKMSTDQFRIRPGEKVKLSKRPTKVERFYKSKPHYRELLGQRVVELQELQDKLYASNTRSVLFVMQAMDAAGKDGAIKHVMSGLNPQGCQVFSFKQPSSEELDHDFLWRAVRALPERGRIGIFNRSYYEEVLVVRVHPEILKKQGIPDLPSDTGKVWKGRFRSIADFEAHLERNGTRVVKFYLHLSKGEQKKRFLSRIDDPAKNWKFVRSDIEERGYWNDYAKAYEECMEATSTKDSPWYVVPADDKQNARLIVSRVVVDTLASLKLKYPKVDDKQKKELEGFRKLLA